MLARTSSELCCCSLRLASQTSVAPGGLSCYSGFLSLYFSQAFTACVLEVPNSRLGVVQLGWVGSLLGRATCQGRA